MTCKTCKLWMGGYCDVIDTTLSENPATLFEVDVQVSDDSGLHIRLRTGPDFGCVLHTENPRTSSNPPTKPIATTN
jgi:hypothetical protein